MTPSTTGLRVEFDQVNKILLIRFRGRLTDESLVGLYEASRRYSTATKAEIGIVDFTSVTEFALTSESIRRRARQKPATADPRIIVVPQAYGFGLFRMLQLLGEAANPLLEIVHTLEEVFAGLGIPSPHFEPLGWTALSTPSQAQVVRDLSLWWNHDELSVSTFQFRHTDHK
jgi:hypothetical protein